MTPLQQACLTKVQDTARLNLEFFKAQLPNLYQQLMAASPNATIEVSEDGDITIRPVTGDAISIAKHALDMEARLERFVIPKNRVQIVGFQSLWHVQKGTPSHGKVQSFHYSNLDADFPNRLKAHFTSHYKSSKELLDDPDFGEREIPILIVFGAGTGWHLNRLVTQYRIRHLIVVETDIEKFRQSTFFQDYVELRRLANERDTGLSFTIEPCIEKLAMKIVALIQVSLPPFFAHGAVVFSACESTEDFESFKQSLPHALWDLFFGLGYFDDEYISIRHTFQNLQRGVSVYDQAGRVDENAVAFIIGSGPSLDGLMPLIKKCRESAVLMSCGTALAPLFHEGIRPDIHFEKERPNLVLEVLETSAPEEFKKEIHFIGASVVHPGVFDLFKSGQMILKSTDTSTTMIANEQLALVPFRLNVQPTVTNMALGLAVHMGFKRIYLFGVDLGFHDHGMHHSQNTVYLAKMPTQGRINTLFSEKMKKTNIEVDGNFGGRVKTTNILNNCRGQMESFVRTMPSDVSVFNLNDGAAIEGVCALRPEMFALAEPIYPVRKAVDEMMASFDQQQLDLNAMAGRLISQVDQFIFEFETLTKMTYLNKREVLDKFTEIYRFLFSSKHVNNAMSTLFRGSILNMLSLSYQIVGLIPDEGEAGAKVEFDLELITEMLHRARALLIDLFTEIGITFEDRVVS